MVIHRTEIAATDIGGLHRGAIAVPIRAVGVLDGALREEVTALKYGRNRRIARDLGDLVAGPLAELVSELPTDAPCVVTWIPTAPSRARRRGFDHAELIARRAARAAGLRCRRLLRRVDESRQTGSDRRARATGPRLVAGRGCRGHTVVLVDDVVTTGATVRAAVTAVMLAGAPGAACVCVASVGRGQ
ncbi:MAG: ComF family protein [Actinomycetota bacterium]